MPFQHLIFLFGGRPREAVNRSQQLARYLAEGVPVSYFPYRSLRELLDREWGQPAFRPLVAPPRYRRPTSITVFLGRRFALPGRITGALVAGQVRAHLRRQDVALEDALLLAYTPVAAEVVRRLPEAPLHYDCADDHEHWHGATLRMQRLNRANEAYVATRARTVTATSQALAAKMRRYNERVLLSPNGVDYEMFSAAWNGHRTPADLAGLARPLIGFVGATQGYVDFQLVAALSAARLGTLVFVGPLGQLQRRAGQLENVRFLGMRPYPTLPQYLQNFDVTIIPAADSAAARAANPGKLYQYLASGRPIVTTDLPEFEPYRNLLYIARGHQEFISQVRAALNESPHRRQARQDHARDCSWERRAAAMLEFMRRSAAGRCS